MGPGYESSLKPASHDVVLLSGIHAVSLQMTIHRLAQWSKSRHGLMTYSSMSAEVGIFGSSAYTYMHISEQSIHRHRMLLPSWLRASASRNSGTSKRSSYGSGLCSNACATYSDLRGIGTCREECMLPLDEILDSQRPVRILRIDLRLNVPQYLALRIRTSDEVEYLLHRRYPRTGVRQLHCCPSGVRGQALRRRVGPLR